MMKRDQCLKALARHRTNAIVVAVYQAAQNGCISVPVI